MQLSLNNISLSYGQTRIVDGFNLNLEAGQIGCFLGPSGCGKTTIQRAIAGFHPLDSGEITLVGRCVSTKQYTLAPEKRKVGMVFQDFALFPHLSVEKNIAFGLKHLPKVDVSQHVGELLDLIELSAHKKKYPHQLSGGQQQRVALARAIAPKPDILLLDEPFSSLDSTLRESLAKQVRLLLKRYNMTAILVTHDQHEAFAFADKVGVIQDGELLQWDTPYNLYHKPLNMAVAKFVGDGVLLDAQALNNHSINTPLGIVEHRSMLSKGQRLKVLIRPDDIVFDEASSQKYTIVDRLFRGSEYLYHLALSDGTVIPCVTASHVNFAIGEQLSVTTDLKHLIVFA